VGCVALCRVALCRVRVAVPCAVPCRCRRGVSRSYPVLCCVVLCCVVSYCIASCCVVLCCVVLCCVVSCRRVGVLRCSALCCVVSCRVVSWRVTCRVTCRVVSRVVSCRVLLCCVVLSCVALYCAVLCAVLCAAPMLRLCCACAAKGRHAMYYGMASESLYLRSGRAPRDSTRFAQPSQARPPTRRRTLVRQVVGRSCVVQILGTTCD
jgi:hypothetical protein